MNMQNENTLNMQSHITAMDQDLSGKQIIAGGRDFLKLITVNYDEQKMKKMEIKLNLSRRGTKHSIGYLEFNKMNKNKLVAGSQSGYFSVWDIAAHDMQSLLVKEHQAAIHRLNWSPTKEHVLISGGQDGLINIYDTSLPQDKCVVHAINRSQRDGVRDVKFNPFNSDQFLAATDQGHFEYYDMRYPSKYIFQKQYAHTSLIYCIDWNKNHQNVFASGSTEKELKVWSLLNSQELEERVKIQLIDGAAQVKWHSNNHYQQNLISVASLNRDVSVTTYDINYPFRPQTVIKGQKELITCFVFNKEETIIITAAKDGMLMMQHLNQCLDVYSNCPRYPITFKYFFTSTQSQNNEIAYKLESPKLLDIDIEPILQRKESSGQSDQFELEVNQISPQAKSQEVVKLGKLLKEFTGTPHGMIISQSSNQINLPTPNTLKQQKDSQYKQSMQNMTGGAVGKNKPIEQQPRHSATSPSFNINSQMFQYNNDHKQQPDTLFTQQKNVWNPRPVTIIKSKKQDVSYFWEALLKVVLDYETLRQDNIIQSKIQLFDLEEGKSPNYPMLDSSQKSRGNSLDPLHHKSSLSLSQGITKKEIQKPRLDLKNLYKYFEKFPSALKQELQEKNIIIFDNQLRIKKERVPYYQELLANSASIHSLIDKEAMIQVLSNSCHDLIQEIINKGELQSGYWMFLAIKNLEIIPEQIVQLWTLSYIDLLLSFENFSHSVKVAQECPIKLIRDSNNFKYDILCGTCGVEVPPSSPFCNKCTTNVQCSICCLPIKGLVTWCQVCQHGGHAKEYYKWFEKNEECPFGCGHKCFVQKNLKLG